MTATTEPIPEAVPSILEQTPWEGGFYQLPPKPGSVYFNCGLVNWQGRNWLVTRRSDNPLSKNRRDSIVCWMLEDNRPILQFCVRFYLRFKGENHEDPRAIVWNNQILLTYCNYRHGRYAHQALATLDNNFFAARPAHPVFGKNGPNVLANNGHEKNWTWFLHDEQLHVVYSMEPFHLVCQSDGTRMQEIHATRPSFKWGWGTMRGGSPPVRVGDEYFAFFHSSTPDPKFRRRYHMGAYAFEALPPFAITRVSPKPILTASEMDVRLEGAPLVIFPSGALLENGKWLVTSGVNDSACHWMRIPHDELLETLEEV